MLITFDTVIHFILMGVPLAQESFIYENRAFGNVNNEANVIVHHHHHHHHHHHYHNEGGKNPKEVNNNTNSKECKFTFTPRMTKLMKMDRLKRDKHWQVGETPYFYSVAAFCILAK